MYAGRRTCADVTRATVTSIGERVQEPEVLFAFRVFIEHRKYIGGRYRRHGVPDNEIQPSASVDFDTGAAVVDYRITGNEVEAQPPDNASAALVHDESFSRFSWEKELALERSISTASTKPISVPVAPLRLLKRLRASAAHVEERTVGAVFVGVGSK